MVTPRFLIPAFTVSACMLAAGCGEMKPRPTADSTPVPPPVKEPQPVESDRGLGNRAGTVYGKAYGAAEKGVRNAEEYHKKIGEEADEIIRNPGGAPGNR